jgi:putative peptide zinc metalloprotease protein
VGTPPGGNGAGPPKLADGIELAGEYKDSGFREPPSIARRADGQIIQLPQLLYMIAEEIDGSSSYEEIAARVTERFGRGLAGEDVEMLVDKQLRPLGVAAQADGSSPTLEKADPLLGLKFRAALIPATVVRRVTTLFYPFFFPVTIALVLAGVVAADIWLFFVHGIAQSARELAYNPLLLLMVFGLVVLATALHEIGHATATRYGGARPGVMGAGVDIVWPAFYTDVTDAYRLGRWGRVRVDVGGIFFNGLFALATLGAYFLTDFEPLLLLVLVQHFQVLQQLLPLLRLDGYYILSDLTGVPDLFSRLRPTLASLIPGRETSDRVKELKPWVRWVITAWVFVLVPFLLFVFGMMIFNAPRIIATAWDSFLVQLDKADAAFADGKTATGMVSGLQMTALALPALGAAYSFSRAGSQGLRGGWRWAGDSWARRGTIVLGTAGLFALLAFVWWPNGDYKPIQPGERGTVQGAVKQYRSVASGRPGLTPEREQELGGAPPLHGTIAPDEDPTEAPVPTETVTTEGGSSETVTAPSVTSTTSTNPTDTTTTPAETATTDTTTTTTTTTTTETTTTP